MVRALCPAFFAAFNVWAMKVLLRGPRPRMRPGRTQKSSSALRIKTQTARGASSHRARRRRESTR